MDKLIDELWENREIQIETPEKKYNAILKVNGSIFDTKIFNRNKLIGYCVVIKNDIATYNLNGSLGLNHPSNLEGCWAVEVDKKYKKINIGHAALSFGIGAAILDTIYDCALDTFQVNVSGINGNEDFYKKFGFHIFKEPNGSEEPKVNGIFCRTRVPNINIER